MFNDKTDICKVSCNVNALVTCSINYTFAVKVLHFSKASPWEPSSFIKKEVHTALELGRIGFVLISPIFVFDFGTVILSSRKQTS